MEKTLKRSIFMGFVLLALGDCGPVLAMDRLNQDLFDAALSGDLPKVQDLVEAGADPNVNTRYSLFGETVLMRVVSVRNPNLDVVRCLVEAGANIDAVSDLGHTALMSAVCEINPSSAVVRYLVEKGANVKAASEWSGTVLEMAVTGRNPNLNIVRCLVEAGANVNAVDRYDYTVLKRAVYGKNQNLAVIAYILFKSIDSRDERYERLELLFGSKRAKEINEVMDRVVEFEEEEE